MTDRPTDIQTDHTTSFVTVVLRCGLKRVVFVLLLELAGGLFIHFPFLVFLVQLLPKLTKAATFCHFVHSRTTECVICHFIVYNFKWIVFASHSTGVQNN